MQAHKTWILQQLQLPDSSPSPAKLQQYHHKKRIYIQSWYLSLYLLSFGHTIDCLGIVVCGASCPWEKWSQHFAIQSKHLQCLSCLANDLLAPTSVWTSIMNQLFGIQNDNLQSLSSLASDLFGVTFFIMDSILAHDNIWDKFRFEVLSQYDHIWPHHWLSGYCRLLSLLSVEIWSPNILQIQSYYLQCLSSLANDLFGLSFVIVDLKTAHENIFGWNSDLKHYPSMTIAVEVGCLTSILTFLVMIPS